MPQPRPSADARNRRVLMLFGPILGFLVLLASSAPSLAQTYPPDLSIVGLSGSVEPWRKNETVRIEANGVGNYAAYYPESVGLPLLSEDTFVLTVADLDAIWAEVVAQGFFGLPADTTDAFVDGGSFVQLSVKANGVSHTVKVRNTSYAPIDQIVVVINSVVPPPFDLGRAEFPSIRRATDWVQPDLGPKASAQLRSGTTPATMVAYCCPLDEAVRAERVTITGRGGALGDVLDIGVNNLSAAEKDTVKFQLCLEFYCEGATQAKMEEIRQAVVNRWDNRMTSSGKVVRMCVVTKGDSSATTPPMTPGFHQIKLSDVPDPGEDEKISFVSGRNRTFTINDGVGSGCWEVTGPCLGDIYAHECGHLLGLGDKYDDWRKDDEGMWSREDGGGGPLTTPELAALLTPKYPEFTLEEIEEWFDDVDRVCPFQEGHKHDIMARKSQDPLVEAIDFIANEPGLKVSARAGDILVNEDEAKQNLVVTEDRDLFVKPGETDVFFGVETACIDEFKDPPSFGDRFDVASRPKDWNGFDFSEAFQDLLDLINGGGHSGTIPAEKAIYWFTDQSIPLNEAALELLANAGVENPDVPNADIPHVTNPGAADSAAAFVLPIELLAPGSSCSIDNPYPFSEAVSCTASVLTPNGTSVTTSSVSWSVIGAPAGSTAQPTPDDDFEILFEADTTGVFQLQWIAEALGSSRVPYPVDITGVVTLVVVDGGTETFESGSFASSPFAWVSGGEMPWTVTDATSFSGGFSAQSGAIGDDEVSSLEIVVDTELDWDVTFARKVSSALGDNLTFTVNGVVLGSWSGEVDWAHQTWDLFPGSFTLKWEYAKDAAGSGGSDAAWIDDVFLPVTPPGSEVPGEQTEPLVYRLAQCTPNPIRSGARIAFEMPVRGDASLTLYDISGRQVAVLLNEVLDAGAHHVAVDGSDLAQGVYFYRLRTGGFSQTRKLVIAR